MLPGGCDSERPALQRLASYLSKKTGLLNPSSGLNAVSFVSVFGM